MKYNHGIKKKILSLTAIAIVLMTIMAPMAMAERTGDEIEKTVTTQAGLVTSDMNTGLTPTDLVNNLLGAGVSISGVTYTGSNKSAGTFTGGTGIIGFESGIVLSSGCISNIIGPNNNDGITCNNARPGDADLDHLIPQASHDATVLEFDFVPSTDILTFSYVFGSDEYNEYVNSPFNDVFGFFVNGNNIALVPAAVNPVSINNINNGYSSYGALPGTSPTNPGFYINNDLQNGGGSINTELDGLTVVLTATANVDKGQKNHIKLAIADAGDWILDSDIMIKAESFTSPELTLTPFSATNKPGEIHVLTATLVDAQGAPLSGATITFEVTAGPNFGLTGTGVTDASGIATWSYTSASGGTDTIVATGGGQTSNLAYKNWGTFDIPEFPSVILPVVGAMGVFLLFTMRRKN